MNKKLSDCPRPVGATSCSRGLELAKEVLVSKIKDSVGGYTDIEANVLSEEGVMLVKAMMEARFGANSDMSCQDCLDLHDGMAVQIAKNLSQHRE